MEQIKAQAFIEQAVKDAGLEVFGDKAAAAQENSDNNQVTGNRGEIKK
jgi:hypothetical protein